MENALTTFADMAIYIVPFGVAAVIILLVLAATSPKVTKIDKDRLELLESLSKSEIEDLTELEADKRQRQLQASNKWFQYWYKSFNNAAVGRIDDIKQPGTVALMIALAGLAIGVVFLKGIGAIVGPAVALVALSSIKNTQASKKNAQFDSQLGLLIDSMGQNIQAGASPSNALKDSIDELPDPLYSELLSVKYDIEVGTPIDEILADLGERNESREMKFLASALRISIIEGGDLVPQLKVISEKLEARARITRRIKEAVAGAKPTIMLVAFIVPAVALFSYTKEDGPAAFASPIGIAVTIVCAILYALGLYIISRMIQKASKF